MISYGLCKLSGLRQLLSSDFVIDRNTVIDHFETVLYDILLEKRYN